MGDDYFARHRERLDAAVAASAGRTYYSAFGESMSPWAYPRGGESRRCGGLPGLVGRGLPGRDSRRRGHRVDRAVAVRLRPRGALPAGRRPRRAARPVPGARAWRDAGPDGRVGVCLEILDRLPARGFEIASAVRHTTGQPLAVAFSYSVASALDRSLEALAWSWRSASVTPPNKENTQAEIERSFLLINPSHWQRPLSRAMRTLLPFCLSKV